MRPGESIGYSKTLPGRSFRWPPHKRPGCRERSDQSVSPATLAHRLRAFHVSFITARKNTQCAKEVRQMKRITGLAAGVLATLLMAGHGLAADAGREPLAVEKPGKLAMPHRVTGN